MNAKLPACRDIERSMLEAAMAEASPSEGARVQQHLNRCASCRRELEQYQAVHALVVAASRDTVRNQRLVASRKVLQRRLADLRQRLLFYGVFPSPAGPILIACSEKGVSLVEYLGTSNIDVSRMSRTAGIETVEHRGEVELFHKE